MNRAALLLAPVVVTIAVASQAAPLIESAVGASSTLYDTAGFVLAENSDSAQTLAAGVVVSEAVFDAYPGGACPSPGGCFAASASAVTDFGSNRVRSYASEYDEHPNGNTRIEDSASARSLWADDWSFQFSGPGSAVTLDIALDGFWGNWGRVSYEISIVDASSGTQVAYAIADSTCACAPLPPPFPALGQIPLSDGGNADGRFDATFQLTFVPLAGATYRVLAILTATSEPAIAGVDGATVDVFNTARVTAVRLANGMTLSSAAGAEANYNVMVPEPSSGLCLLVAGVMGIRVRGRGRG
ncbi:MAG: hypothetical protein FJ091_20525 [Deltaproteobacteria bacterium]|nr:hypothetical protein [Deltaproteobacteria bacterium]